MINRNGNNGVDLSAKARIGAINIVNEKFPINEVFDPRERDRLITEVRQALAKPDSAAYRKWFGNISPALAEQTAEELENWVVPYVCEGRLSA